MAQEAKAALTVSQPTETHHDALELDFAIGGVANAPREGRRVSLLHALESDVEGGQTADARREVIWGKLCGDSGHQHAARSHLPGEAQSDSNGHETTGRRLAENRLGVEHGRGV